MATETLPTAFAATLTEAAPPEAWPSPLAALWWLAKDPSGSNPRSWEEAHTLVQETPGSAAAWVHAHLHRIEGDSGNARYWYDLAGQDGPRGTVAEERAAIVSALLAST